MAEGLRHGPGAFDSVARKWTRHRRRKDVALARVRKLLEAGRGNLEVLAQNLGRCVLEPVSDQERIVFVEVAVVENEKKFAAVGAEPLNRMRDARGKVPEVANSDVVNEVAPVCVDGGE